ncbi:MAG: response regulator transcription factor [Rhizobiales bacterium]|nr:response regulator transcription factor [Hyphomicrobiales bacterium]NRB13596.1 response regulator transcription factor [Hyphomicrobiales bacterium]
MDYNIVIADDHPLCRGALNQTVRKLYPDANISEAENLEDLVAQIGKNSNIDLILLDLAMPGVRGFSGLLYLRSQHPNIPISICSASEDSTTIRRALDFGASGFIPKSASMDIMTSAIHAIMMGEVWIPEDIDLNIVDKEELMIKRMSTLTPQQMRVLMMVSEGLLNKQIAFALNVSEATIKAHVSAILQKLNVESRTQAVIVANRLGVVQNSDIAS